jgi:cbb3-type cytochrome oxidase maturation protein
MSVIYIILPVALVIAAAAVAAFIWAVRSGQMDDLKTPGMRMLHDDEPPVSREGDDESEEHDAR